MLHVVFRLSAKVVTARWQTNNQVDRLSYFPSKEHHVWGQNSGTVFGGPIRYDLWNHQVPVPLTPLCNSGQDFLQGIKALHLAI